MNTLYCEHMVVIEESEKETYDFEQTNIWDDVTSGDYVVHGLYIRNLDSMPILDDNIHSPVETEIEYFLKGYMAAAGAATTIDYRKLIVFVPNGCAYNTTDVKQALFNGNFIEAVK